MGRRNRNPTDNTSSTDTFDNPLSGFDTEPQSEPEQVEEVATITNTIDTTPHEVPPVENTASTGTFVPEFEPPYDTTVEELTLDDTIKELTKRDQSVTPILEHVWKAGQEAFKKAVLGALHGNGNAIAKVKNLDLVPYKK